MINLIDKKDDFNEINLSSDNNEEITIKQKKLINIISKLLKEIFFFSKIKFQMKEKQIKKTSISTINGPTNNDTGSNKTEKNKIFICNLFFLNN